MEDEGPADVCGETGDGNKDDNNSYSQEDDSLGREDSGEDEDDRWGAGEAFFSRKAALCFSFLGVAHPEELPRRRLSQDARAPTQVAGGPVVEAAAEAANPNITAELTKEETTYVRMEATTASAAEDAARLEKNLATPSGSSEEEKQPGALAALRMKHTTRFRWQNSEVTEDFPDCVGFIREFIFRKLGLTTAQVVCIQRNGPQRFVDVTVLADETYQRMVEICKKGKDLGLKQYKTEHLWWTDRRIITVHVFNPFVPAEAVCAFIQPHVDLLPGHREIRGEFGIWNGCRQFQAYLCPKPVAPDGLHHPLAYFTIQNSKAYLFYPQQPPFCRLCQGQGHTAEASKNMKCRNCLETEHFTRDCKGPRRYNICCSEDHLVCLCPQYRPSYADAFSRSGVSVEQGFQVLTLVENKAEVMETAVEMLAGAGEALDEASNVRGASPALTLVEIQKRK
ncbi:hypothetical protein Z043_125728 [Scleropages formosus]|uniref:CCHC-type domain-containing protein n=1 Tax=Scleropages formosus TaxID=113540 RepID=A0A0P7TSZ4_SCLFO|nr:hypothetical protein Z043_125728 [Scleropages formosus]